MVLWRIKLGKSRVHVRGIGDRHLDQKCASVAPQGRIATSNEAWRTAAQVVSARMYGQVMKHQPNSGVPVSLLPRRNCSRARSANFA